MSLGWALRVCDKLDVLVYLHSVQSITKQAVITAINRYIPIDQKLLADQKPSLHFVTSGNPIDYPDYHCFVWSHTDILSPYDDSSDEMLELIPDTKAVPVPLK